MPGANTKMLVTQIKWERSLNQHTKLARDNYKLNTQKRVRTFLDLNKHFQKRN